MEFIVDYFYYRFLSTTSTNRCSPTGESAPPTAYLEEPTPNICRTVVDGNAHKCAFSFDDFLDILVKICNTFGWKPDLWLSRSRSLFLYLYFARSISLSLSVSLCLLCLSFFIFLYVALSISLCLCLTMSLLLFSCISLSSSPLPHYFGLLQSLSH